MTIIIIGVSGREAAKADKLKFYGKRATRNGKLFSAIVSGKWKCLIKFYLSNSISPFEEIKKFLIYFRAISSKSLPKWASRDGKFQNCEQKVERGPLWGLTRSKSTNHEILYLRRLQLLQEFLCATHHVYAWIKLDYITLN